MTIARGGAACDAAPYIHIYICTHTHTYTYSWIFIGIFIMSWAWNWDTKHGCGMIFAPESPWFASWKHPQFGLALPGSFSNEHMATEWAYRGIYTPFPGKVK